MARVLIIDDDVIVSRLLEEHLSNEGYEVTAVPRAEQGFAMAVESPPDLILLDVFLPDATGFQMCGRFRAHAVTQAIPIIMITGAARWPNQQAIGKQMGANEYILKPFDVIQVGERVHSLLGSKRPAQTRHTLTSVSEPLMTPESQEAPARVVTTGDEVSSPPPAEVEVPLKSMLFEATPPSSIITMGEAVITPPLPEVPPPPVMAEVPPPAVPVETPPAPILLEATPAPSIIPLPSQDSAFSVSAQVEDQRFFDFSAEILILVSRLPDTRAGRHVADQLLRTGTSVGARFLESQITSSKDNSQQSLQAALKDLRETGYWLMLIRNAGLLEASSIKDLETKCHQLAEHLSQAPSTATAKTQL